MIAAVNSFTGPWGGPEFGTRVFFWFVCFTTDVALQGSRNYQTGNRSRQLLSPTGRGHCFLSSPSERPLPLGKPNFSIAEVIFRGLEGLSDFLWNLVGVWGPSGVSQPGEGDSNVSPEPRE